MKKLLFGLILLILIPFTIIAQNKSSSDVYVKSYKRSDGTIVKGYYRSSPNNTINDNFSTKGNINPYTGKKGYIKRNNKSYNTKQNNNSYDYPNSSQKKRSTTSLFSNSSKDLSQSVKIYQSSKYGFTNVSPNDDNYTTLIMLPEINFNGSAEGKMKFYVISEKHLFSFYEAEHYKINTDESVQKIYAHSSSIGYKEVPFGGLLKVNISNLVLEDEEHIFIDDGIGTVVGNLDLILEKNIVLTLRFGTHILSPSQLKVLSMFNIKEILYRVNRKYINKNTGKLNENGFQFSYVSKISLESTKELFKNVSNRK